MIFVKNPHSDIALLSISDVFLLTPSGTVPSRSAINLNHKIKSLILA